MSTSAKEAVFVKSESYDEGIKVIGPEFNSSIKDINELLNSYSTIGFQASSLSRSINLINKMLNQPLNEKGEETKCNIFLGYTSNLVSSGLREIIRFLVQHNMVNCLVTTAGGIEEDLIKCLGPTYLTPNAEFNLEGAALRKKGLNRIGNLLVPNDNYCKFEDWVVPILDKMVDEQEGEAKVKWSPSTVIERLGKEIDDESSILYWAQKVYSSSIIISSSWTGTDTTIHEYRIKFQYSVRL
jgi:deoxyhypusine synthase